MITGPPRPPPAAHGPASGVTDAAPELDFSAIRSARVKRGYEYWRGLCKGRLPARAMIDPGAIPDLLPHIVIHGVRREPLDFLYRLVGTEVRRHMSAERTGQWMSQIPGQGPGSRIWANLARIAETGVPILNRTPYEGPLKDIVTMETVQLPLAADGVAVDMILVFVDFLSAKAKQ